MLNPINLAFKKAKSQHRPALLTYTVAGDSTKKQSLEILKSILENHKGNLSQKSSTNNKFISVTFEYLASSPSDVIRIYKEASVIDDIISL